MSATRVAITFTEGEELHVPFARAFVVLRDLLQGGFVIHAVRVYVPGVLP